MVESGGGGGRKSNFGEFLEMLQSQDVIVYLTSARVHMTKSVQQT